MQSNFGQDRSYILNKAIVRKPGESCIQGLRAKDLGDPNPALFRHQHAAYVQALEAAGLEVTVLDPLEAFPDGAFVEDPALCLPESAILLRPGAPSRLGEAKEIAPVLKTHFEEVKTMEGPGFVDGGDVMVTDREILVGLSDRSNEEGVRELQEILSEWGYPLRTVDTPKGVLHFKSDSSPLGDGRILSTKRLALSGCFQGYEVLIVPDGEEAAANALRINDHLLLANGFPATRSMLEENGYHLVTLDISEAAKLDAGLSCLSLRFKG
ncbi:MAG: dimethylarginine dimethylaminohydrolase [Kiloniellales bacterium]|nr:dimethylarginine dimethylaminohydrolase [Kiloniellales bacterium]